MKLTLLLVIACIAISLAPSRLYTLKGEKYYGEYVTKYDHRGSALEFYSGGSEGYIPHKRYNTYGKDLPFEADMYEFHIKIDKKHGTIIDNGETHRNFHFIKGEKKIKVPTNSQGRFIIYEYL